MSVVLDREAALEHYRAKLTLNDHDLAVILDRAPRTIGEMARDGRLPSPRIGGGQGSPRVWSAKAFFDWFDRRRG